MGKDALVDDCMHDADAAVGQKAHDDRSSDIDAKSTEDIEIASGNEPVFKLLCRALDAPEIAAVLEIMARKHRYDDVVALGEQADVRKEHVPGHKPGLNH